MDKIIINLYDKVVEQETLTKKKVDVSGTLVSFFDAFVDARKSDFTDEQIGNLMRLRARVEIELRQIGI